MITWVDELVESFVEWIEDMASLIGFDELLEPLAAMFYVDAITGEPITSDPQARELLEHNGTELL